MPNPFLKEMVDSAATEKQKATQLAIDCITIGSLDIAMVHLLSAIKFESGETLLRKMYEAS